MSDFILDRAFLLEKFPGKGGWTYASIPEIKQNPNSPFGWVKVSRFIDDIELKQYKLMPMGEGCLFMPVKAAYRKKLKKEAGDYVLIKLRIDDDDILIPEEITECLAYESVKVRDSFNDLSEGEKKSFFDWIYSSKNDDLKAERIAEMFKLLAKGIKKR